ncbi:MAG: BACON domain-containing protein [Tannerellaceae bacterium]|jgi:hypothetical protein|nr:BACON domain-containing protein [Tannerellaceae bacterium]
MKKQCLSVILSLNIAAAVSQDCNSIYQGGLEVFRRRTSSAIQDAVKRFEAARRCYELTQDAAGVKQCEQKISEANTALASLNPGMRLSRNEVSFAAAGGEDSITVTASSNLNWSVSPTVDWISAGKKDRGTLLISVEPNTSVYERRHSLALRYGSSREASVSLVQAAAEASLSISDTSVHFPALMEWDKVVEVASNIKWEVADVPDWCKVRPADNLLVLSPLVNDETADRSALIRVVAGSKVAELAVSQANDHIRTDPPHLTFKRNGEKKSVSIIYVDDVPVPFELINNHRWCTVRRIDDKTLEVQCFKNDREEGRMDTLHIRKRSVDVAVPIYQEGKKGGTRLPW